MDHIIEVVVKVSATARVILLRGLYAQRSHVVFVDRTHYNNIICAGVMRESCDEMWRSK